LPTVWNFILYDRYEFAVPHVYHFNDLNDYTHQYTLALKMLMTKKVGENINVIKRLRVSYKKHFDLKIGCFYHFQISNIFFCNQCLIT